VKLAKYIFAGAMLLTAPAMADELKMATIAPGTTTYRTTATFATIINQNQDDFSIILDATGAAPKHMMELAQGKLDIAVSSPVMFDFMKNQKGMFEKISSAPELSNNLRLLMWFPYGQNHIVVSADSDIKTLEDIRGKKVFLGPPGGGAWTASYDWLKAASGLDLHNGDYEDFKGSWASGMQAFQDGQVDVYIAGAVAPAPSIEQLAVTKKIRLLGLSKEEWDANTAAHEFIEANMGRDLGVIRMGIYNDNVEIAHDIYALSNRLGMVLPTDMDEDLAYRITKTYWDNVDAVAETSPWLKDITLEYAVAEGGIKLHPGALRYYEERGVAIPEGSR